MNKTAAFFVIAMLTLAAACGAAQPPEDWNKKSVAFRSKGKLYVYAHENRAMSFGTFIRYIAEGQQKTWAAGDNGNWILEIESFNKKLNKNQTTRLRFFKAPEDEAPSSVFFAEMSIDGRPADFLIERMVHATAEKALADMAK